MRSISAAMALYALCLSTLIVSDTLGQKRPGNSRSPKAESSTQQLQDVDAASAEPSDGANVIQSPSSSQTDITGPAGSGLFGQQVVVLPNGNIVVTDPTYDITTPSTTADVGAVYLFDGNTLEMISQLTGSTAGSAVGNGGVTVLANGNYVVRSVNWNNGAALGAGAVTFGSGETGVSGVVSADNSLVSTTSNDNIGNGGITALPNGNYVVSSQTWANGAATNAGAATWGNGTTGVSGALSDANSLVGSSADDNIGNGGITVLANGNYVIRSHNWGATDFGAVSWGSGTSGVTGPVSSANSLIGSTAGDGVGAGGVTILANGNYLVISSNWDNGATANAGAVTWGSGTTGVSGAVSSSNSIVGSTANDNVGISGVRALTNGNYVISSSSWDRGGVQNAGAVTWGNGATGSTGAVSLSNSLVGTSASDGVGNLGITVLENGNYAFRSTAWDNGAAANAGAVTWGNGTTGTAGSVSSLNSLVGSTTGDQVGIGGIVLVGSGNYVVSSHAWDNAAAVNAGAVTWCNGSTGKFGPVSPANSLVGSATGNQVGLGGIARLSNGNYVSLSANWDNVSATNAGAVTWGPGNAETIGVVSVSNSLVGTKTSDSVGSGGITALANGNYVVVSSAWRNGTGANVGAVTWGNGVTGTTGTVTESNSLVGSIAGDSLSRFVVALNNGNYVVSSQYWSNGTATYSGAVTWGNGSGGTTGAISASNSLVGSSTGDSVGYYVNPLTNGHYVVLSPFWSDPSVPSAGAVTWGNGMMGTSGSVTSFNSLIGSTPNDSLGYDGVELFANGNYLLHSNYWDNGALTNARAVTYGAGNGGIVGVIDDSNSVLGTVANGQIAATPAGHEPFSNERLVVGRPSSNTVTIFNPTYRAVADGNWSDGVTWNYGAFEKAHDVVIPEYMEVVLDADIPGPGGSLTIEATGELSVNEDRVSGSRIRNEGIFSLYSGKLDVGSNVFTSACGNNEFISTPSSYIIGAVEREFCVGTMYQFPIGSADGYTPVQAHVTSVGASPSSLTVSSTASAHPTLFAPNSLKRFWSITESGDLTADLTFRYLDGDVEGSEAGYKLYRIEGAGLPEYMSTAVHYAGTNSMSITGVSQFSDWSIGSLTPSAAGVTVTGRVMAGGRPVSRAYVSFSAMDGSVRYAVTNTFGYYRIDGLLAGSTYIAAVESRRYTFDARVVNLGDDVTGLDFVGR